MKRKQFIVYLLVLFCLPTTLCAGGYSVLELSAGGGWSSMGYKTNHNGQPSLTVKSMSSWNVQGHIGYAYMFTSHIGLGVGVDFARIGGGIQPDGTVRWLNVGDTEAEKYNHLSHLSSWKEKQEALLVELPISIRFGSGPTNSRVEFTGEVGALISFPVKTKTHYSGTVTHDGDYGPWGLYLEDVANHGFYTTSFSGDPDISMKSPLISAYAKLGIQMPISEDEKIWFYAQVYGAYAFTNAFSTGDKELGFRNDGKGQEAAHAFMADYTSMADTKFVTKANPVRVGVEVGVRFFLFPIKKYPCNCVNDRYDNYEAY